MMCYIIRHQQHYFLMFKVLWKKQEACAYVCPKNVAKLWTLELFSPLSSTSRSFVVSTTKVIQQLKTRVVTCSRINCYVFKVYWSAGTQINEPIDWGTITRKWKTILGFSSPSTVLCLWGFGFINPPTHRFTLFQHCFMLKSCISIWSF